MWETVSTVSADVAVSFPIMSPDDLVGVKEIAELGNVRRNSAWRWTQREGFPEPEARLSTGPVWRRETIEGWLERSRPKVGRPPSKQRDE